jgi:hypothetical protein
MGRVYGLHKPFLLRRRFNHKRHIPLRHSPFGHHPGASSNNLRYYNSAEDSTVLRLIELVTLNVCGYPNVWGVYWQPKETNREVVVVATPPVTRLVQFLLDSIANQTPDAIEDGWHLRCSTVFPDEPSYRCAYRKFA